MSLNDSVILDEISCYDEILNCFQKSHDDSRKKEICRDRSIIKLMKLWNAKPEKSQMDKIIIRNSIIFVLSLFEDEEDPPDLYNSVGKDSSKLENSEKEEFIENLKLEFL